MPAKGQKRKQQIIEIAKSMFIEKGFQSTHIGQVCDELKIARGTVYQYFGNKREILFAILENVEDEIDDIFDRDDLNDYFNEKPTKTEIIKFLENRVTRGVQTLISEPIIIKLLFKQISGIDDEISSRISKFLDYISRIITGDIEELKNKKIYRAPLNSNVTSTLIVGGILLLVNEYERKGLDVLKKETINSIVDMFMEGMVK